MELVRYEDFARLDIRVAKVTDAKPVKGKTRIMAGRVDLGGGDERSVIIGGAQYHTPEEMIGRTVIVIANLEPKRVAGIESDAMLLAADVDDRPVWLTPSGEVSPGAPVR